MCGCAKADSTGLCKDLGFILRWAGREGFEQRSDMVWRIRKAHWGCCVKNRLKGRNGKTN